MLPPRGEAARSEGMDVLDYHNEYDAQKAAWLRHLIEEGAIPPGVVDCRPIQEVQASDLKGFTRCHFFSGIGIWPYALGLAGWAPDVPVWTGSCPCGPFSRAGLQKGFDDPRHLWPEWFRLVRECRPDCIFGEQSDAASQWIDLVSDNLEGIAYAFGAPDIPAAGFSGAHKRQRFYWVADTDNTEWWSERAPWHDGDWTAPGRVEGHGDAGDGGAGSGLDNSAGSRCFGAVGRSESIAWDETWVRVPGEGRADGRLGDASGQGPQRCDARALGQEREALERAGGLDWVACPDSIPGVEGGSLIRGRFVGGHANVGSRFGRHGDVDWLWCRDSTWRPVEPGTSPLVDENPARMGRLRGYGDAVDAETAAQFIAAYMECRP